MKLEHLVVAAAVILAVGVLWEIWRAQAASRRKKTETGETGVIKNLTKCFASVPVPGGKATRFELHTASGDIFYAAIPGHWDDMTDGMTLKFWSTGKVLTTVHSYIRATDDRGREYVWTDRRDYFDINYVIVVETPTAPE